MPADRDDPQPQKPPASSAEREARLAKALRDNLRRRKPPPPAGKPAGDERD
jgi:hypothetical protein